MKEPIMSEETTEEVNPNKDENGAGVPDLSDANNHQREEVRAAAEGREPDFSPEHLASYEQPMTTLNPQGGVENEVTAEMLDRSVGAGGETADANVEHEVDDSAVGSEEVTAEIVETPEPVVEVNDEGESTITVGD
jgi:hypothetical protein